jgi:hypothetical protein
MYTMTYYVSYLTISLLLTAWVVRVLERSGKVFLRDAFRGNEELAEAVNRLLVIGFYLVNLGYIAFTLKTNWPPSSVRDLFELESTKLGLVLLILGIMHCFNVVVLAALRFMNMIAARLGKHSVADAVA